MNIHDKLSSQIACVGLPLFAVSLTAVPYANTPALLMLHWHGFRKNPDREYQLRGMSLAVFSGHQRHHQAASFFPAIQAAYCCAGLR